ERIVVVDLDKIEESKLSRTILYRSSDVGSFKADVAARSAAALAPNAKVKPLVANVVQNCGLGIFAWSDVIIAGLDNREARLWINRCAWKLNRPWIDGAIAGINGIARFVVEGLNHTSYKVEYTANPDCMSHFTFENVTELPRKSSEWTLEDLRQCGAMDLGTQDVVVEFSRDIVHELECPECGTKEELFAPVGSIGYEQGRCPSDGQMRVVKTIHCYDGSESFGQRTIDKLGLPLFDV